MCVSVNVYLVHRASCFHWRENEERGNGNLYSITTECNLQSKHTNAPVCLTKVTWWFMVCQQIDRLLRWNGDTGNGSWPDCLRLCDRNWTTPWKAAGRLLTRGGSWSSEQAVKTRRSLNKALFTNVGAFSSVLNLKGHARAHMYVHFTTTLLLFWSTHP